MVLIWWETRTRRSVVDTGSTLIRSGPRERLADAISRLHLGQVSELPQGIVGLAWKAGPTTLDIEVTDVSTAVIDSFTIQILDVHRWADDHQRFVEAIDVHERGKFGVLTLHVQPVTANEKGYVASTPYRLFHGTPLTYLFLSLVEDDHLQFGGQEGSSLRVHTIKTPGTWRVSLRLTVQGPTRQPQGGIGWVLDRTEFMFFQWNGKTLPTSCNAPSVI